MALSLIKSVNFCQECGRNSCQIYLCNDGHEHTESKPVMTQDIFKLCSFTLTVYCLQVISLKVELQLNSFRRKDLFFFF